MREAAPFDGTLFGVSTRAAVARGAFVVPGATREDADGVRDDHTEEDELGEGGIMSACYNKINKHMERTIAGKC